MKKRWVYFFLLFGIGVGGGYALSRVFKKDDASLSGASGYVLPGMPGHKTGAGGKNAKGNYDEKDFWQRAEKFSAFTDFKAEWEALKLPEYRDSAKVYYLLQKWGRYAPRQALETLQLTDDHSYCLTICREWGKTRPEQLAEYYKEMRAKGEGRYILDDVLEGWGATDPVSAAKWLATLSPWEQNTGFQKEFCNTVLSHNPGQMKAVVKQLPESILNNRNSLTTLMKEWMLEDPAAALEWKNSLPEAHRNLLAEYDKVNVQESFNSLLANMEKNPQAVREKMAEFPPSQQKEIMEEALNKMGSLVGLEKAREWRDQYCTGELEKVGNDFFRFHYPSSGYYYFMTPSDMRDKIQNTPEGASKKELRNMYDNYFASQDYEGSISFALENSQGQKPEKVWSYLYHWGQQSPEQADRYLQKLNIYNDKEKDRFREIWKERQESYINFSK